MLWLTLGVTALVTLAILAVTAVVVVGRLKKVRAQVDVIEQQLMPSIEQLQADLAVTSKEIARISGDPGTDEEHDVRVAEIPRR